MRLFGIYIGMTDYEAKCQYYEEGLERIREHLEINPECDTLYSIKEKIQHLMDYARYCKNALDELSVEHRNLKRSYDDEVKENKKSISKIKELYTALQDMEKDKAIHISKIEESDTIVAALKSANELMKEKIGQLQKELTEISISLDMSNEENAEMSERIGILEYKAERYDSYKEKERNRKRRYRASKKLQRESANH